MAETDQQTTQSGKPAVASVDPAFAQELPAGVLKSVEEARHTLVVNPSPDAENPLTSNDPRFDASGKLFKGIENPVVLSVNDVYKDFKLPTEQATGLKQAFINWTRGIRGYRMQHVLKGVSFQVHQGEFFGIVGRNGGGKSTLLKIISQIYYPNKGSVQVTGKLVPFIELGVGFNPELTGRENVYLNGALLGFTKDEVDAMYDDIVEFAELGDFMDQKLKDYSSGMQVRLAFSVAIKAQGDILVLDEVLAVGDEAFQRKCDAFFAQVKKDPTKTVILVTHDMSAVKKYCTRAMMISDGRIVAIGDKNIVADRYTLANLEAERRHEKLNAKHEVTQNQYPEGLNERCPILRTFPISSPVSDGTKPFRFGVEYQFDEPGDFYLAISLHDTRRGGITYDSGSKVFRVLEHGHHSVEFELPVSQFNNGEFELMTSLRVPSKTRPTDTDMVAVAMGQNSCSFVIRNERNRDYALLSDRSMRITPVEDVTSDQALLEKQEADERATAQSAVTFSQNFSAGKGRGSDIKMREAAEQKRKADQAAAVHHTAPLLAGSGGIQMFDMQPWKNPNSRQRKEEAERQQALAAAGVTVREGVDAKANEEDSKERAEKAKKAEERVTRS